MAMEHQTERHQWEEQMKDIKRDLDSYKARNRHMQEEITELKKQLEKETVPSE